MVAALSNEETQHNAHVDQLREVDKTDDTTGGRTMSGPEAVGREMAKVGALLAQLRAHPGLQRHTYERLHSEAETMRSESRQTDEHSAQFILAERARKLSQRIENLLSV